MSPDAFITLGATIVTGGFAAWGARSARRTKRQEKRDDFTAVTEQQGKAIERLEKRVEKGETEVEKQRERIGEQDEVIAWLLGRVRDLVGYIRTGGGEPPQQRPMSQKAAQYLHNIDV
ncbi:hypothetical protein ACFQ6Q_00890 [Streptomyces sp. NPDC056437]|uniref:hypothetical protein n=1 Tax=Streptomyces sp. NPDC056437 TaxID=3345816 RepID=UPI0036BA6EDB